MAFDDPVLPPPELRAGWYPDPWKRAIWRWWDGEVWTARTRDGASTTKPKLNSWLSIPVVFGLIFTVGSIILLFAFAPTRAALAIALGLVPLLFVLPVLSWLDRVEPEPRASRIHAVLWGATVAGSLSGIANSLVALEAGDAWAAVVSAPLVEEFTKGLGVYWALRRKEIDGVMDGIVYAGWVALGFAVIEDFTYFTAPTEFGDLLGVFLVRAVATPFAHPLFTAWIGLAIGLAVARRQSVALNALWGYGLAVACHATWNGVLTYSKETGDNVPVLLAMAFFVLLFFAAAITVIWIRRNEQRQFTHLVPALAARYGLSAEQVTVFANWRRMLATRKALPKTQRAQFDNVHAALARLALYHRRSGAPEPATEQLLANQLHHAMAAQADLGVLRH